jgi:hypothetical protein
MLASPRRGMFHVFIYLRGERCGVAALRWCLKCVAATWQLQDCMCEMKCEDADVWTLSFALGVV